MNNRQIKISTAGTHKSTVWPTEVTTWLDFTGRLKKPQRTTETYEEFMAMKSSDQSRLKDVGGFVGGTLRDARRKKNNVMGRDLVTLDMDNMAAGDTERLIEKLDSLNCAYEIYSTRKHSAYRPRIRVIIPTDREMTADEYEPIARKLAMIIGMHWADPTTFEPERLMYWPSCSSDSEYIERTVDGGFMSADGVLKLYSNWKDISEWPQVPGHGHEDHKRLADKQEDPTTKKGVVGAFCKTYDILEAIETFIPNSYEPTSEEDRLTFTGGSTSGGARLYGEGKFLYSWHATDPCGGKLVNSWDLIRLHKFGELDSDSDPKTNVTKLPSFLKMKELASGDSKITSLLDEELLQSARGDFSPVPLGEDMAEEEEKTKPAGSGRISFQRDDQMRVMSTIDNFCQILEYDENLKGKIALDEFAVRITVSGALPWNEETGTRAWSDVDESGLRHYIETNYKIKGRDAIQDALALTSFKNRYNVVEDYLRSCKWDGVGRAETLFIDYYGCEDNAYTRAVTRKILCAGVARALHPGIKFDNVVILVGPQGIGKSEIIKRLGGQWFSDSLDNFDGKNGPEQIQGRWIIELGELGALNKAEITQAKHFISKQVDIYRASYARNAAEHPRRCVFFGTTNEDEFLRDRTGNRRFWPLEVNMENAVKNVFTDMTEDYVNQIWAEALFMYEVLGEKLYLDSKTEEKAREIQSNYVESNSKEGIIKEFLERKIPVNWEELDIQARRAYLAGGARVDESMLAERERVCVMEIWVECFGRNPGDIRRVDSYEISGILKSIPGWNKSISTLQFKHYGKQKGYTKQKLRETIP